MIYNRIETLYWVDHSKRGKISGGSMNSRGTPSKMGRYSCPTPKTVNNAAMTNRTNELEISASLFSAMRGANALRRA
eukprot:1443350-Rhodomonas_salina.2